MLRYAIEIAGSNQEECARSSFALDRRERRELPELVGAARSANSSSFEEIESLITKLSRVSPIVPYAIMPPCLWKPRAFWPWDYCTYRRATWALVSGHF
jgi:hypothetical protein